MFSLSNISIKIKILVLFLIPAIALVYQVSVRSFEKYAVVQEDKTTQKYVQLSVALASLVHESQKERGLTAGFLGSHGKKFGNTLPKQRLLTDTKAQALRLEVEHLQAIGLKETTSLQSDLEAAMQKLSKLQALRAQITSLSISKETAIVSYTKLNTMMLNTIASISKESSNPDVVEGLSAYVSFLRAKERMGIERAVGTGAFASKSMNLRAKEKFASLRAQQEAFLEGKGVLVKTRILKTLYEHNKRLF